FGSPRRRQSRAQRCCCTPVRANVWRSSCPAIHRCRNERKYGRGGTAMTNAIATISAIYEAFGRGDVTAILDLLSDNVAWEPWADNTAQCAGVPWLVARQGKTGAGEFFRFVGQFQIHEFKVLSLIGSEQQVAAEVVIDATVPGGKRYRDEELHLWNLDE